VLFVHMQLLVSTGGAVHLCVKKRPRGGQHICQGADGGHFLCCTCKVASLFAVSGPNKDGATVL